MDHKVSHDLGRDLAKKATAAAFAAYSAKYSEYNPSMTWTSDYSAKVGFKVKGVGLDGKIQVNEHDVVMDLDVPFLLKPFRSMALEVIEREIKLWIGKAKSGELT
jgi:hypothetical protein